MEDYVMKNNLKQQIQKIEKRVLESLDFDIDKVQILREFAKSGVSPEDIAGNMGVSLQTVQLALLTEKLRRSLENISGVVIKDIVPLVLNICQEMQDRKTKTPTEHGSKADSTGVSEQQTEPNSDLDQREFFRELGLTVPVLAQMLNRSEADTAALMGVCITRSDQISGSEVQPDASITPQTTAANEPIVAGSLPQCQRREERAVKEPCSRYKDNQELHHAMSELKGILSNKREKITIINRNEILTEVMEIYNKHPSTAMHELRVKFEGEEGCDYGGLTKDMLASFWNAALNQYFYGEDILVPHVNLDQILKGETDLKVIGRILSHTVALTGTLPFNISAGCLISAFHGGNAGELDLDLLLEEYSMFVNCETRLLMEKAQMNFAGLSEDENEFLLRIFETHGHRCLPTQANIKEKLTDIAVKVLIHEPARHLQQMKEGMPEIHIQVFWSRLSKRAFRLLAEKLRPSPGKTASVLTPTRQLTDKESEVFAFLVHFVERLNKKSLRIFLQFVTGYTRLPNNGIKISFNPELRGALRRPIAHTCSNQLDLPLEYKDLEDFETEMKSILDNPLAMHMYLE